MEDPKSKGRRQILLGAGAVLANATLAGLPDTTAAAAIPVRQHRHSIPKRWNSCVVNHSRNPWFVAQGKQLSQSGGVPPAVHGGGMSAGLSDLRAAQVGVGGLQAATVGSTSTLVLYDTTGPFGWLGEIYGTMVANLASHFGTWTALPVVSYTSGLLANYTACVYIGSTYDEPLPPAFVSDVFGAVATKIIWIYDNIWQVSAAQPQFAAQFGWAPWVFDFSSVATVTYKSQALKRFSGNGSGIMTYSPLSPSVTVLATAVRSDSTTLPWAVRSGNLTYIGENPLVYMSEGDRYLIFTDLLFDALAPATATQHRALLRLEDIHPETDTTALRTVTDWLFANNIPFGFQISARYLDPNGFYTGTPDDAPLHTRPAMVSAINYMLQHGGTMICHGYTHQYSNVTNPYTGVTGDDCEFYRITSTDGVLTYAGPVTEDATAGWAQGRFNSFAAELSASGLAAASIVTFPDYAASVPDYRAAAATFTARAERSLYFKGVLSGGAIDYTRVAGQYFPYTVHDIYGCKVLGDTLGGIDPTTYFGIPPHLPADIIADAQRTLVVRDGYASFFFNPEDPLTLLQQTVTGIKGLGYQFVGFLSA